MGETFDDVMVRIPPELMKKHQTAYLKRSYSPAASGAKETMHKQSIGKHAENPRSSDHWQSCQRKKRYIPSWNSDEGWHPRYK